MRSTKTTTTIIQSIGARGASASVERRSTISKRHFLFANDSVVDRFIALLLLVLLLMVVVVVLLLLLLVIDVFGNIVIILSEFVISVHYRKKQKIITKLTF